MKYSRIWNHLLLQASPITTDADIFKSQHLNRSIKLDSTSFFEKQCFPFFCLALPSGQLYYTFYRRHSNISTCISKRKLGLVLEPSALFIAEGRASPRKLELFHIFRSGWGYPLFFPTPTRPYMNSTFCWILCFTQKLLSFTHWERILFTALFKSCNASKGC